MTSILCDTNIIIEGLKGNEKVVSELQRIGPNRLAISVITSAELYYGALNKTELAKLKKHLGALQQLALTPEISDKFLELMGNYGLSHRPGIPDMLIAATAIIHNLELYTLNVKDFRYIPALTLYQP